MCQILVIYHSQSGKNQRLAQEAAKGVDSIEKAQAILKKADQANLKDLMECHGLIIASPEYFGYMAGMIKDFFDRTYEAAQNKKEIFKKPYALIIGCGNDGTSAIRSIERICKGYPFKKVTEPLVVKGPCQTKDIQSCFELGQLMAAGIREKIFY